MAGRFVNPYPQYMDSTPDVYSLGFLEFYESGTSTPLDTYNDPDLAAPHVNQNPLPLNAAGRPGVDIFLQDLAYKVVLKDASNNAIWTADPVYDRDQSLIVKTNTGSGNPNGSLAGTAGSSGVLPDFYWDYTNSILYVCTITGNSSTAVWTAINASAATPSVPPPQGRLTLTSGLPVLATDAAAQTAVYYTPYVGNLIPIYNGASMVPTEFSELTLSLVSSHAASTLYDIFVFSNSGVPTIVTGPAWTTSTAAAGARGTGASTTELTRIKGIWVNAVQMTARNGSTTYSVGANLATYVGTMLVDGSAGQVTCHVSTGQSRKWGLWNAYNRVPVQLRVTEASAGWSYTSATIRPSNNSTTNSMTVLVGLPEEIVNYTITQGVYGTQGVLASYGIGYNSTTAFSGTRWQGVMGSNDNSNLNIRGLASYLAAPTIGINVATSLETGGTTINWGGNEANMLMTANFRA